MRVPIRSVGLSAGLAIALLGQAAEAQYQTQNRTARQTALKVSEIGTPANGLPSWLTLEGQPNFPYFVFCELYSVPNQTHQFPIGGTPVYQPINLDIESGNLIDLTPALPPFAFPGAIPSLTFFFPPIPWAIGTTVEFQAHTLDPVGGVPLSNGVRRTVPGPLAPSYGWTGAPMAQQQLEYIEIEQADVDADGDQDTLLLDCAGVTIINPSGGEPGNPLPPTTHPKLPPGPGLPIPGFAGVLMAGGGGQVSSMELADLDDDYWYDLIIGGDAGGMNGISFFLNLQRPAPMQGSSVMGAWNGFGAVLPTFLGETGLLPFDVRDLEVADMNQDGLIDVVLATPNNVVALLNLGVAPLTFLIQAVPTGPVQDNRDVELSDLDGDWDFDIVVASGFDPSGTNPLPNRVLINVSPPGGLLAFQAPVDLDANNDSRFTCDVVTGDVDGDGDLDIYAANAMVPGAQGLYPWYDDLYLGDGLGGFAKQSFRLPDNPAFIGPPAAAVPPWDSSDAEVVDFFRDGSLLIGVAHGFKCGLGDAGGFDLRFLQSVFNQDGALDYFADNTVVDTNPATGLGWMDGIGVNDLETGDWQTFFPDADIGIAHRFAMGLPGASVLTR